MGERKGQRGNIPRERAGEKDESRIECKNPLFWKLEKARSGIVMHTFGRSQAAGNRFGANRLEAQHGVNGVSFFFFGGFWHVLIFLYQF